MKPPAVLPVGSGTWSWIRQGGKPHRGSVTTALFYRWKSFWFERHLALQKSADQPAAAPLAPPVFILGLWRSGTTFLHDLLSAGPGLIYPATWQCMSPASFRLRPPPAPGPAVQRPMDNFTIDALSPQEDEFALLALGVPSAYRGFLDPRRLPELARWLDPDAWGRDRPAGWLETWLQFLTGVTAGRTGRLVLKSPGHTFRIQAVADAFPASAVVWLVRDPTEVFLSNRKMWPAMFGQYALWDWDESVLDAFLATALTRAAECLQRATRLLPAGRLAVVPFDQLIRAPLDTVEAINRRLALGDAAELRAAAGRIATAKADYQANVHAPRELPETVRRAIGLLQSAQQAALASHGI